MKILMGPVLSLRHVDAEHWHVSALVVTAKTAAPEPLDVRCIGRRDDAAIRAPAKELWVHGLPCPIEFRSRRRRRSLWRRLASGRGAVLVASFSSCVRSSLRMSSSVLSTQAILKRSPRSASLISA